MHATEILKSLAYAFLHDRIAIPTLMTSGQSSRCGLRRHAANQLSSGLTQPGRTATVWPDRKQRLISYVAEQLLIPRPYGIAGQIRNIYPFRRDVVDVLLIKICP
jgi:hypothetical protein